MSKKDVKKIVLAYSGGLSPHFFPGIFEHL